MRFKKYFIIVILFIGNNCFAEELSSVEQNMFKQEIEKVDLYSKQVARELKNYQPPKIEDLNAKDVKFMQKAAQDAAIISQKELQEEQHIERQQENNPTTLVFLSFSLPEVSLQQWLMQAERINASVVLRGLIDNDLRKTTAKIKEFAKKSKVNVYIDPVSFRQFAITRVPAVVLVDKIEPMCVGDNCETPNYLKVYGNGSLYDALEKFALDNEFGKLAKEQLTILRQRL